MARKTKKKTFEAGDRVTLTVNSSARRVEGVVDLVRPDGKLCILVKREESDAEATRRVVRSATFVEHAE